MVVGGKEGLIGGNFEEGPNEFSRKTLQDEYGSGDWKDKKETARR
jgi:hypothetical protein